MLNKAYLKKLYLRTNAYFSGFTISALKRRSGRRVNLSTDFLRVVCRQSPSHSVTRRTLNRARCNGRIRHIGHALERCDHVIGTQRAAIMGGISVIVVTVRQQHKLPVLMRALGVDINAQRSLIIKSRGHLHAWSTSFFSHDRVIEVDVPRLPTPALKNVPYEYISRPLYPPDDDWGWQVGEPEMFVAR